MYQRFGKRALDIVLSAVGLVVLLPVFLAVALLVKADSPGPVFFRQKRVGKDKVLFEILKFRTMRTDTPHDVPTHQLSRSVSYITRVGRVLRKTSMDELPQLINILLGQMSIIGPRPALWNQDDLIACRDLYGANNVLPGLSGWAQVNGRDELAIDKKALRDGEYAQNVTFALDAKCFFLTIVKVFRGEGVAEGKEGRHYTAKRTEEEP
ncbi:MAG: sugar transferase [Candidatus Limiplasma sp.]|nr:sugar transferase [Candidatus Limiplasma sp.]MEA5145351.1 sugar transferase [Candidatus Limiplasma sp.]